LASKIYITNKKSDRPKVEVIAEGFIDRQKNLCYKLRTFKRLSKKSQILQFFLKKGVDICERVSYKPPR